MNFPAPVDYGHDLQGKAAGISPEVMQRVNLIHVASRV